MKAVILKGSFILYTLFHFILGISMILFYQLAGLGLATGGLLHRLILIMKDGVTHLISVVLLKDLLLVCIVEEEFGFAREFQLDSNIIVD